MKKLLIFALAAMGMVACVKEEVTLVPEGSAISFESAFINNSTRAAADPSTNSDNLTGFNVWGFVSEYNGTIFTKKEVKKVESRPRPPFPSKDYPREGRSLQRER